MTKPTVNHFLSTFNRSPKTIITYRQALAQFELIVGSDAELDTTTYIKFLKQIRNLSPSTQRVYRTAVLRYYKFCKAGDRAELDEATEHYMRRQGARVLNFSFDGINKTVTYCSKLSGNLLNLRDRAFVLLLADTGLRISEACSLKRGTVDWKEQKAIVIGKGDKQAQINISNRATCALKDYIAARSRLDGASGKPLGSLPLFASHDIRARKHLRPIQADGMRKAIKYRMKEAGVDPKTVRIHDFRHYAISVFYEAKGDVKATQIFGRHSKIETTGRYTHLKDGVVDRMYDEVFNNL